MFGGKTFKKFFLLPSWSPVSSLVAEKLKAGERKNRQCRRKLFLKKKSLFESLEFFLLLCFKAASDRQFVGSERSFEVSNFDQIFFHSLLEPKRS